MLRAEETIGAPLGHCADRVADAADDLDQPSVGADPPGLAVREAALGAHDQRPPVSRAVANGSEVVTDVSVTDGDVLGRAISFFTVERGLITRIVEFWPEPYPAPATRAHLVEPMA